MKENYPYNDLKDLMENVDLPDSNQAWQKMSSLLDSSPEFTGETSVGKSVIFKTIIWLNSIFLVLTSVVVGAMYQKSNKEFGEIVKPKEEKGLLTIHYPPHSNSQPSKKAEHYNVGDNFAGTEAKVGLDKQSKPTIHLVASDSKVVDNSDLKPAFNPLTSSQNSLINTSKKKEVKEPLQSINTKILGESNSPGVSNINDEEFPAFTSNKQKPASKDMSAVELKNNLSDIIETEQKPKDFAGDSSVVMQSDMLLETPRLYYYVKTGIGLNRHTSFPNMLKQMQFGGGLGLDFDHKHGVHVELLYNPVAIKNQNWVEIKEFSYLPYENDITVKKLNYLSLPVLLKHRVNINWTLFAGAQQSLLLSKTGDVSSQIQNPSGQTPLVTTYENTKDFTDQKRFEKWNTAFVAQAEYRNKQWLYSAKSQLSVTDITNNISSNAFDGYFNISFNVAYILSK